MAFERGATGSFDIISFTSSQSIYGDYTKLNSHTIIDADVQCQDSLRSHYPEFTITAVPTNNVNLLEFVALGHASIKQDTKNESVVRTRGYLPPKGRDGHGAIVDVTEFAKYYLKWQSEEFILYVIGQPLGRQMQYLIKEPGSGESPITTCALSDALIYEAGETLKNNVGKFVFVFDLQWKQSKDLWNEIQKSSWDKVILDNDMKKSLQAAGQSFFDGKDIYDQYGISWKRGLIFAGPPGNGKTISIKALSKTLYSREKPIPTLYVKAAPLTFHIGLVFQQARIMAPCMLVFEDVETIVTPQTRSYFFNEVDGLAGNSGILMVATTNYLDRLDPGLSKRPSRFDRKFYFPMPNESERTQYAEFWRQKLEKSNADIEFPKKLCPEMAKITPGFSFAFLQEAFIASLLSIAEKRSEDENDSPRDDLNRYELWRVFQKQVHELRKDLDGSDKMLEIANISEGHKRSSEEADRLLQHNLTAEQVSATTSSANGTKELYERPDSVAMSDAKMPVIADLQAAGLTKRSYFSRSAYDWHI